MEAETSRIFLYFQEMLKKIKNDKKSAGIIIICCIVSVFLVFSEFDNTKSESKQSDFEPVDTSYIDTKEIEAFLENISGVGKVDVMITYDATKEYIYAKDVNQNTKSEINDDKEINYKSEHIIIKEDGNEKGLKLKEIYPEIRGVAVICEGGDNPVIKEQIVCTLSALFDINTNRISVAVKGS